MPALNFTVFIDKILSGEKRQTIRQVRERPIKPGDKLYLYTGMRHKNCRKLGEAVCSQVIPVEFARTDLFGDGTEIAFSANHVNGHPWPPKWEDKLALDDGFNNWDELTAFFVEAYKITWGQRMIFHIIKWRDFEGERGWSLKN